jgi:hypothetical protein
VSRLDHRNVSFYIHINRVADIAGFRDCLSALPSLPYVTWLPRENSYWAGPGITRATLHGLAAAAAANPPPDYILFLSGQDYPIKPTSMILDFLQRNMGKTFLQYAPFPVSGWTDGGWFRFRKYHFWLFGRHFGYPLENPEHRVLRRLLNFPARLTFPEGRRIPDGLKPYGGWAWWAMSLAAARYVVDYVSHHGEYLRFFNLTLCTDEMFYQTILLNSAEMAGAIVNSDLTYANWTAGGSHPAVLTTKDFDDLEASPKLFARKFDMASDPAVLDMIDQRLLYCADEVPS